MLTPTQLIELAARTGTDAIALTDHDNTDGLEEAEAAARRAGIGFVPGVEISVSWGDTTLHVVGLKVDPASAVLRAGLEQIRPGAWDARALSRRRWTSWGSRARSTRRSRSRGTRRC